jgi:hypothetical protein
MKIPTYLEHQLPYLLHGSRELFASTMDFPNLAGVRRLPHHYMNGASGFHGPDDTEMLATELRADIRSYGLHAVINQTTPTMLTCGDPGPDRTSARCRLVTAQQMQSLIGEVHGLPSTVGSIRYHCYAVTP